MILGEIFAFTEEYKKQTFFNLNLKFTFRFPKPLTFLFFQKLKTDKPLFSFVLSKMI